jgi:hypothetical protein
MSDRHLHVLHLLIRTQLAGKVHFLCFRHETWSLTLPTKKTLADPRAATIRGRSLEEFVDDVMQMDLGLAEHSYVLEQELPPVRMEMTSPSQKQLTRYTIFALDVFVAPEVREVARQHVEGQWLTCEAALLEPGLSPTARCVLEKVLEREHTLEQEYQANPKAENRPAAARRLLTGVPDRPSMDGLARRWRSRNRSGVAILESPTLEQILDVAPRSFNLRVADPYLPHQKQGVGFTWSFFTHRDPQDLHLHGAPIVEIYGILEGELEIWWKHHDDRGSAAWSHRVLGPGDWVEIDALHCHIVHFRGEGRGVVFKAGPGPLAEVGRVGVAGKTLCHDCLCMKPDGVCELESWHPG